MRPMIQTQQIAALHDIFEQFSGSFFITDLHSNILYATTSIFERTGYRPAQAIGKKPRELWGGSMPREFYGKMWQSIRDEKKPFIGNVRNHTRNGRTQEETIYIAPILSEQFDLVGYLDVQPYMGHGRSEQDFYREFLDIFSSKTVNTKEILKWALPWMIHGKNDYEKALQTLQTIHHESENFSCFIQEVLVQPTQEKFLPREEDKKLIQAAQADHAQFYRLYEKYKNDIFQYFLGRVGHHHEIAEECTQETFLRAFRSLSLFRVSNASYKTYLVRIAHNILLNYFRKKSTVSLETLPHEIFVSESRYQSEYLDSIITKSLCVLTPYEQEIFILKYQNGYSTREISTCMQTTENAVKLHLSRSRKKLRAYLSP